MVFIKYNFLYKLYLISKIYWILRTKYIYGYEIIIKLESPVVYKFVLKYYYCS